MFTPKDSELFTNQAKGIGLVINFIKGCVNIMLDERAPLIPKIFPVLALVYLVFPFDLIPDLIPVFGQMDDVAVIGIALFILLKFTPIDVIRDYLPNFDTK